jgi:lipopolysaccharide biosynthesis regulator YciM
MPALFALGEDHFRAGLSDRAEEIFKHLSNGRERSLAALRHLLRIYQPSANLAISANYPRGFVRARGQE